jgi:hypothetical protein
MRFRSANVAPLVVVAGLAACLATAPARAADATLELVSTSPLAGGPDSADAVSGSATSLGLSADGSRVFFSTVEPLVEADTDGAQDVYQRTGGVTTLLSDRVQAGADAETPATLAGRSLDGTGVLILTAEPLVPEDGDAASDVYVRAGGSTVLVTDGPSDSPEPVDPLVRASGDLSRVLFATRERLAASDDDSSLDTYLRDGGSLIHVSDRQGPGDPELNSVPSAISLDGARVFFTSAESLAAEDDDGDADDVYQWTASAGLELVSDRTAAGPDQNADVAFAGRSTDGSRVFFATEEPVTAGDGDAVRDMYMRSGGTTRLLSDRVRSGSDAALPVSGVLASADGSRAFFVTRESLVTDDSDSALDLYENAAGVTRIVSDRFQPGDDAEIGVHTSVSAQTVYVSSNGTHVLFTTREPLVAGDRNGTRDVYERFAGATRLVSSGSAAGLHADVDGISGGGARAFFHTNESLSADDTDGARDVYERAAGTTFLLSDRAQPGPDAGEAAFLNGISADGARVSILSAEPLLDSDPDPHLDVYQARLSDPRFVDGDPPGGFDPPPGGGGDDDPTAGVTSACVQIQPGVRRRTKAAPGGGQVVLTSSQTTNASVPLRLSVGRRGAARVASVTYSVNGRAVTATKNVAKVPLTALKVGRRNTIKARVTLAGGRKVTVREVLAVVRCPVPKVTCKRLSGGTQLRCSATLPRRTRRVRVTVTGRPGQKASGSTRVRVKRGSRKATYKLTMRPRTALPAGSYVYRHVATTTRRGERLLAVRVIVLG